MKKQAVPIAAAIVITLVGMAWYQGWQVHQLQLARVGSFASYYQVLNGYLQTTYRELQQFAKTDDDDILADCVSDMQTVERMALPLAKLAPKAMSSFWIDFLDHNWNAVTKSLVRVSLQNGYFGSGQLPDRDQAYLQFALQKLQALTTLMEAPVVSEGDAPGVRIRLDQLVEMNKLADELVAEASCYVKNGMLQSELPTAKLSWQEAESAAREVLQLSTAEWKLVGDEQSVMELTQGYDYYHLRFEPTSDFDGPITGVSVGIDRQSGHLVRYDWDFPATEGQLVTEEELQQWALAATEGLPGPKAVLELFPERENEPAAVVVPLQQGEIPVLSEYVLLGFHPNNGQVSKWENYGWNESLGGISSPRLSQATARARLIAGQDLDSAMVQDKGMAVVRSPFTDRPALVYWFQYTDQDDPRQPHVGQYFINAANGKLERTDSGW